MNNHSIPTETIVDLIGLLEYIVGPESPDYDIRTVRESLRLLLKLRATYTPKYKQQKEM